VGKSAGEALETITGQKFGRDENAWRRWWRASGDDFLASAAAAAK
jgi:hypothetical protein